MTALVPLLHRQPSSSGDWLRYFESNVAEPSLPWRDPYRLTPAERAAVVASIRQFQLGESGKGRRLLDQAARFAVERGQPEYWHALRLFVKEEQRHSRMLGRFLELHGIGPLDRHWVDSAFRGIRVSPAPKCVCACWPQRKFSPCRITWLYAKPRRRRYCGRFAAASSKRRRCICDFRPSHSAYSKAGARPILGTLSWIANRTLLAGATAVLWREHRGVFSAAGYSRKRLANEAARWFAELG